MLPPGNRLAENGQYTSRETSSYPPAGQVDVVMGGISRMMAGSPGHR